MNTKEEIQKAIKYFKLSGIHAYNDDESVYIVTNDSTEFHIMISTSEVIYRAELLDESEKQAELTNQI